MVGFIHTFMKTPKYCLRLHLTFMNHHLNITEAPKIDVIVL